MLRRFCGPVWAAVDRTWGRTPESGRYWRISATLEWWMLRQRRPDAAACEEELNEVERRLDAFPARGWLDGAPGSNDPGPPPKGKGLVAAGHLGAAKEMPSRRLAHG
jgi:hypothetical protein